MLRSFSWSKRAVSSNFWQDLKEREVARSAVAVFFGPNFDQKAELIVGCLPQWILWLWMACESLSLEEALVELPNSRIFLPYHGTKIASNSRSNNVSQIVFALGHSLGWKWTFPLATQLAKCANVARKPGFHGWSASSLRDICWTLSAASA